MNSDKPFVAHTLKLSPKWRRESIRELENFLGPSMQGLRKVNDKPWGWEMDVVFTDDTLAEAFITALNQKEIGL